MLGTNWTAPDLGATVEELLLATQAADFPPGISLVLQGIPAVAHIGLELTGQPLCGYDHDRIRVAARNYRHSRGAA